MKKVSNLKYVPTDANIKEWYISEYPDDDLGNEINPEATLNGLVDTLNSLQNVYDYLGVGDSIIRERVFEYLANTLGVEYDNVYYKWLDTDEDENDGITADLIKAILQSKNESKSRKDKKVETEEEVEDYGPFYVKCFDEDGHDMDTIGFETQQEAAQYASDKVLNGDWNEVAVYDTASDECLEVYDQEYLADNGYLTERRTLGKKTEDATIKLSGEMKEIDISDTLKARKEAELKDWLNSEEAWKKEEQIRAWAERRKRKEAMKKKEETKLTERKKYWPAEYHTYNEGELSFVFKCQYYEVSGSNQASLWGHDVELSMGGNLLSHNVTPYYNRTWETFPYQTCMLGALNLYMKEVANELIASEKRVSGIRRMKQQNKETALANNNWYQTLKAVYDRIADGDKGTLTEGKSLTESASDNMLEKAFRDETIYWLEALVSENANDEIGKQAQSVLDDKAKIEEIVSELVNGSDDIWEEIHIRIENLAGINMRKSLGEGKLVEEKVTVYTYGQPQEFNSREEAIAFFKDCANNSEGAEQERYENVLYDLKFSRENVIYDDEPASRDTFDNIIADINEASVPLFVKGIAEEILYTMQNYPDKMDEHMTFDKIMKLAQDIYDAENDIFTKLDEIIVNKFKESGYLD